MSNKCEKCGNLSIKIMEAILSCEEDATRYTPDALFRVFVYLARAQGWSLEMMKKEALKGLEYYYVNDEKSMRKVRKER